MHTGFDNEWFSLHKDMKILSDRDFLPSQMMHIPQTEEVKMSP
jgi:hypothetical protein